MKELPDFSLFLEKNYGLRMLQSAFTVESNELVFKVQTVDNQWFGLKIYRSAGAPNAEKLSEIWAFVAFLADRKLVVQSPVLNLGGGLVSDIFFEKKTCAAVLFHWLDGKNLTRWASVATAKKWGELLGEIHGAAPFSRGAGGTLTVIDALFVKKNAEWLPAVLPEHGFSKSEAALFSQKLGALAARDDFFGTKNGSFGLIHSDLHPGNLLRTGRKLAAIDWDDLAFGPFLLDIAVVFNEMQRFPAEKSLPLRAAFLDGYRLKFDLPVDFEKKFPAALDLADLLFASWVFHPKNDFVRTPKLLKLGERAVLRIMNSR